MKKLDISNLKRSVVIYIMIGISILLILALFSMSINAKNNQENSESLYSQQIDKSIKHIVGHYLLDYTFRVRGIVKTTILADLLELKDRKAVLEFLKPKYDLMKKENPYLTVMHVHLKDGTSFLRLHKPDDFGDDIAQHRPMLQEIHKNHKMISGYENGIYSTPYRVIAPIFSKSGEYLGAFEIGLNPNFIIDAIRDINGFCGIVLIKDKYLKLYSKDSKMMIDGYRLQTSLNEKLRSICEKFELSNSLENGMVIEANNKKYLTLVLTLKSFTGQDSVKIVFFQDITNTENYFNTSMYQVYAIIFLVLLFLTYFIYRRIGIYQNKIESVYIQAQDELNFKQNYLQAIFDVNSHVMITTDGQEIDKANPAMLKFFDYETIEKFKSEHDCICDFFIGDKNCLKSEVDGMHWLEYILVNNDTLHNVCMEKDSKRHYFKVHAQALEIDDKKRSVVIFNDVTELEELGETLEIAVKGTNDGLWDWNIKEGSVYFSPRWKNMLGFEDDELPNVFDTWESRVHPDDIEEATKNIALCHADPKVEYKHVHRLRHKNGSWVWILDRGQTIFDDSGTAVRMVGFHTDITKQKELEIKLISSQEQFNQFMEYMPANILIKERGVIVYANSSATDFFKQKNILGKKSHELFPPAIANKVKKFDEISFKNKKHEDILEIIDDDNKKSIYRNMAFVINKEDEKLGVVTIDITKEYLAQHEVRKLKSALDRSPISIMMTDINGDIEYVNPNYTKVSGYTLNELLGKNPRLVKSGYTSDKAYKEMWGKISSGGIWSSDVKNIAKDGSTFWEDSTIIPSLNNDGKVDGYIAFKLEITEQKKLKKTLELETQKATELGKILKNSINEIYIFEKDSLKFIYINRGAKDNIGYTLEDMKNLTPIDIKPNMSLKEFNIILKPILENKKENIFLTTVHQRKDGSVYPVDIYLQSIVYENIDAYIAIVIDITQRQKVEKELQEKDEMMIAQSRHAAMGEMISMIAHQWRQPISVIAMQANNILVDIELESVDKKELYQTSKDILHQTQELSKTIDDFKEFFKPDKHSEKFLVKNILEDALNIIGKSLENNNIELILNIDDTLEINTFSRELMQVFINIIKNAKEVLLEKNVESKSIFIDLAKDNELINISICDNAGGINSKIFDKIFNPYFTTKGEKNGTGLGLYMSKTIVEKHLKGRLNAFNKNSGACFEIKLPFHLKVDTEVDSDD